MWESVELSWLPGADGGYAQAFALICRSTVDAVNHTKQWPVGYIRETYNLTGDFFSSTVNYKLNEG